VKSTVRLTSRRQRYRARRNRNNRGASDVVEGNSWVRHWQTLFERQLRKFAFSYEWRYNRARTKKKTSIYCVWKKNKTPFPHSNRRLRTKLIRKRFQLEGLGRVEQVARCQPNARVFMCTVESRGFAGHTIS